MDNLTHTLTGLLLSRAGLNKIHPQANLLLMISANVPDIDVVSALGGASVYFQYHRWITHSLIAIPVMALIPVLLAWSFRRREKPRLLRAWLLCVIGVVSHLLLDFTNPYGIRLFLPWDGSWPMLSITSVIDIWIWAILIFAALWPVLGRLVNSEIGAKQEGGAGLAITALLLVAAYDAGRYVLHERAVSELSSHVYNGESPRRAYAFPDKLNPMAWDGIVETGAYFIQRRVWLSGTGGDSQGRIFYKPESSPAIEAAARDPLFKNLSAFSNVLLWSQTTASEPEAGTKITAADLYFDFTATAIVDRNNRVVKSTFRF